MIKKSKFKNLKNRGFVRPNNQCEECNKKNETVSHNLILTGLKICESCRLSKTVFPN